MNTNNIQKKGIHLSRDQDCIIPLPCLKELLLLLLLLVLFCWLSKDDMTQNKITVYHFLS